MEYRVLRTVQERTMEYIAGQGRTGQWSTEQYKVGQDRKDRNGQHSGVQSSTGQDRTEKDSKVEYRALLYRTGQKRTVKWSTEQYSSGQDRK